MKIRKHNSFKSILSPFQCELNLVKSPATYNNKPSGLSIEHNDISSWNRYNSVCVGYVFLLWENLRVTVGLKG